MMKCFMRKVCSCLCYFLLFVFLVTMSGCSSRHAWFNPDKDDLARKQDTFSCEEKAAKFSRNMGKAGKKKMVDQHMNECMEALNYKWVPEETIPKMQREPAAVTLIGGALNDDIESKMKNSPYCTEAEADWCGDCWLASDPLNVPINKWCCTYRKPKTSENPHPLADCVPEKHPENWQYCLGCNNPINGKISDFCTKPPKGLGGPTNIKITNATNKEVKFAFVTGAEGGTDDTCKGKDACKGACPDANKMISYEWVAKNTSWCKEPTQLGGGKNAGFCMGTVAAKSSVELIRPKTGEDALKCLTGAIQLGGHLSCPAPTGFTQGEFTFNPTVTEVEGVDISLVNGVNYALTVNLPGKAWKVQDNGPGVTSIGPSEGINGNNNKNGIFPPGCTDCTLAVTGKIPCPKLTPDPNCQSKRICNVYRGGWTGGTAEFVISDLPK